ncbi:heparinase II/III family protein [Paenibacillus vulneris]|uniref:Heparinase II/III family protein n=1 Tax=Paenibacillus vulneris TaxID=1133364 RepID=A0ABW3UT52_9BACL
MNISEKVTKYGWAAEVLEQLQKELDLAMALPLDIPVEPGGWWHQYVCPKHHTELLFDPIEADAREFHCPEGCTLQGEPYRGAWLVMKHQSYARYALQAAAVYAGTGQERYAQWSMDIVLRYAAQFPSYPVHPEAEGWMLKGRAFHQALTEAIWATTLLRAYLLLGDAGRGTAGQDETDQLELFFSMLEESMTQSRKLLVEVQKKPESNYTAWLNAALACLYARRQDMGRMKELLEGEGGLRHHLSIGICPDQMEYEGSTYYHVFVLRAYFIAAEMAGRLGMDWYSMTGEQGQSFEGMLDVMAALANDQGELIALHDGPYQRIPYAREIAETVEIGLTRYKKGRYVPLLREAYRQMYGRPVRAGLEALVYGQGSLEDYHEPDPGRNISKLLESSGFVIGRRPSGLLSFFADYGEHGGSHGHYDKLHLTLASRDGWLAPELGMVPYGSVMRKEWYACTESHNTVVIGQRSQAAHTGKLVRYEDNPEWTYAWLSSSEAYEGCRMDRHLLLTGSWLLDWFEVELEEEAAIDWWMHSPKLSPLNSELWKPKSGLLDEAGSYRYVQPASECIGQSAEADWVQLTMSGRSGEGIRMSACLSPSSRMVLTETPGTADRPIDRMHGILHRQFGRKAAFITVYGDTGKNGSLKMSLLPKDRKAVELGKWRAVLDPVRGLESERL